MPGSMFLQAVSSQIKVGVASGRRQIARLPSWTRPQRSPRPEIICALQSQAPATRSKQQIPSVIDYQTVEDVQSTYDEEVPPGVWRPSSHGTWHDDMRPFMGHACERVDAPPDTPPIIICPGFGNSQDDYLAPGGRSDLGLATRLEARGFRVEVMPLRRRDWARVLRSLATPDYWKRSCTVDPAYGWFLASLKTTMDLTRLKHNSDQVTVLAHSAGGWLARAFLAAEHHFDLSEEHTANSTHNRAVRGLLTLGTPHVAAPPSKWDMTGGALTWVNTHYPEAHFKEAGVKYTCVAGCAVRGNGRAKRRELSRYSFSAYSQVCGAGHRVAGDGVVPNRSSFLRGAENVLLDGVHHSMGRLSEADAAIAPGQALNAAPGRPVRPWYGSDAVIDGWAAHLL